MAEAAADDRSGTWRKYQYVLWTDVFAPVKAGFVFFVMLVAAMMIALPILQRNGITQAAFYKMMPTLIRRPVWVQGLTALSDLVLLFFLWRIARRVADSSLVARYRPTGRILTLAAGLGGAVVAVLTMIAMAQLAARSLVTFHPVPGEQLFMAGAPYQYPIVILTVALIAPFVEEFYFRGVLLSWLERKLTILPAALLSAVLFGLLHFRFTTHPGLEGWFLTGVIMLVGLVNAGLAIRSRSLWPPFLFHAGYNATLLAASLLASA
jgi:membrane protease YdiL (CAAX protease family)